LCINIPNLSFLSVFIDFFCFYDYNYVEIHIRSVIFLFKQFKIKLFLKTYLFYSVAIILPFVIISLFLSQFVITAYKNNVLSLYSSITDHISNSIDNNLYNIESANSTLKSSNALLTASTNSTLSSAKSVYDLKQLQNELSMLYRYQNAVSNYAVYLGSTETIVTQTNKYHLYEFYLSSFSSSGYSYSEFKKIFQNGESVMILSKDPASRQRAITIIRPLFNDINQNYVMYIASVDINNIIQTYRDMTQDFPTSYFIIADDTFPLIKSSVTPDIVDWNKLLSSKNNSFIKFDGGFLAIKNKAILPSLNYVYIISENELLTKVNFIQTILTIVIVVIMVVLLVVSYIFSCRSFSPFASIASVASSGSGYYKLDSYDDISVLVSDTINTNNSLRGTIDRQRKCINDNLFIMFLQNSMDMNEQAIEMLFSDVRPKLILPFYNVIIINISDYGTLTADIAKLSILESCRRVLSEHDITVALIPNDAGRLIVLANHKKDKQSLGYALKKLSTDVKNNLNVELCTYIGRQIDNLNMFSKSYEDALYASIEYKGDIVFADSSYPEFKNNFFTSEDKNYLITCVSEQNGEAVLEFFESLMTKIFIENTLTYRLLSYIRYSLSETLNEIIYKLPSNEALKAVSETIQSVMDSQDYMMAIKTLADCYIKTVDSLIKQQQDASEDLRSAVESYIKNNYTNPSISLTSIAKDLHFSYSYLCKFFKKEFGCVFLDYLHGIRIKEGKHLLTNTDESISDIAKKLGYLSSNTFIKTFKKYENISPGEYRKSFK